MKGANRAGAQCAPLTRVPGVLRLATAVTVAAALGASGRGGPPPEGSQHAADQQARMAGAYEQAVTTGAEVLATKADFNGDGELDFLTLDSGAHTVTVYLAWKGHGFVQQTRTYLIGDGPNTLVSGDFKVDDAAGCDDVAIGTAGGNSIDLYAGTPYAVDSSSKTGFEFTRLVPISVLDPKCIALGKFTKKYDDLGAVMDLLVVKSGAPKVLDLYAGDGAGVFAASGKQSTSTDDVTDIWPGDHTGDKYVDVVVVTASGALLLKNDGTGRFIP